MNKITKKIKQQQKDKVLAFINSKEYSPMKFEAIREFLQVPNEHTGIFYTIMNEIVKEGKVEVFKSNKVHRLKEKPLTISGVFLSSSKGFGHIRADKKQDIFEDIFIPEKYTMGALHKDVVICEALVKVRKRGSKGISGKIIQIVERSNIPIIGTYEIKDGCGVVFSDNRLLPQKIYIEEHNAFGAVDSQKVRCKILNYDNKNINKLSRKFYGKITEILGYKNDPGIDIMSIILSHNIPNIFGQDVMQETETVPGHILLHEEIGRKDLRNLPTITIDAEDTKDIDDAVSLEVLPNGDYLLGVHIADVSHYVRPNSAIWCEAMRRCTSVYLADGVIPMLPHKLSNGICSLNPNVDRLTLSCIMQFNTKGELVQHEICESIIHSDHKITYDKVEEILTNLKQKDRIKYGYFIDILNNMAKLSKLLCNKRFKGGALDFSLPECKILLDKKGKPIELKLRNRTVATSIIEEFMLVTNETVATEYFWLKLPFIYRNHEEPDKDKLEHLVDFVKYFGYSLKRGKIHAKTLQIFVNSLKNKQESYIIVRQILKSMKQARYKPNCTGHFGLATPYYTHFTSPIRRFPDLVIHNIIKLNINNKLDKHAIENLKNSLPDICNLSSNYERRADACAEDVALFKKIEYMEDKIGHEYEGVISGITHWAIFIELPNTIEGIVSISKLDNDDYIYNEELMQLHGKNSQHIYKMGDTIKIKVIFADKESRKLEFSIIN